MGMVVEEAVYIVVVDPNGVVDINMEALATWGNFSNSQRTAVSRVSEDSDAANDKYMTRNHVQTLAIF